LHQFVIYVVILAAALLLFCAYILGKSYLGKWYCVENVDDDNEEVCFYSSLRRRHLTPINKSPHAHEAFRPPAIALPTPTATGNRSDPWLLHRQMRPVYISQADMLSSGKGFFG
jgi:hypothetical protein